MSGATFSRSSTLPVSAETALAWHERPGAFERLTPPWERVEIVERHGGVRDGDRVTLRTHVGPVARLWEAEHFDYQPGRQFRDRQVRGPFARWDHRHLFIPDDAASCTLTDRIEYALPLGPAGALFGGPLVREKLARMFAWRHRVTRDDLVAHARYGGPPLKIVITGASGLLGTALTPFLTTGGHTVVPISLRGGPPPAALLEGCDAVIHLAGESIADGAWTPARKERLVKSRTETTRALAEALAALARPPRVLVSASAIGWYGHRGEEELSETSAPGTGFLADLCRQWEAAAEPARAAGVRVVNLRFGIILTPRGGALKELLTPFRLGAGGPVGGGRQWMSWVALDDVLGALHHALTSADMSGPVNVVAPEPVRNAEFGRTLGRVLGRPSFLPLPAFAVKLLLGELGENLLLHSQRVRPDALTAGGYTFRFPTLEPALRHLLGRGTEGLNGRGSASTHH